MICPTCCNPMQKTKRLHQYRECGLDNVFLHNCPAFLCRACGIELPVLPNAQQTAAIIAQRLLRQPSRFDGAAILFCRKVAGLDSTELADMLGVDKTIVHRWENDDLPIDGLSDFKLRLEVFERLHRTSEHSRLKDEITVMFRRLYPATISITEQKIDIAPEDLDPSSIPFAKPIAPGQRQPLLIRKNHPTQ